MVLSVPICVNSMSAGVRQSVKSVSRVCRNVITCKARTHARAHARKNPRVRDDLNLGMPSLRRTGKARRAAGQLGGDDISFDDLPFKIPRSPARMHRMQFFGA